MTYQHPCTALFESSLLTVFHSNIQISNKNQDSNKQNKKIQIKTNTNLYFPPSPFLQSINNTWVMLSGSSFEYYTTALFINKQLMHFFFFV